VTQHREIELKLEIDPADLQQLRDGGAMVVGASGETRHCLSTVYFDTPKLGLRQAGFTLRVRADGDRRIQTLKHEGQTTAGLFERPEWSVDIDGDEPDLTRIDRKTLEPALPAERLRARLKPVFRTEVNRTTWRVRSAAADIEIALDEGRVVGNGRTEPLIEFELELKGGSPSELFKLARALGSEHGLRLGVLSKSERGYTLAAKDAPASFRAEPIALQPDMSTADAFKYIVRSCIRQFRLNESLLIATRGDEPLHQCRVALRRLRTALSLFRDVIADDEVGTLRNLLKAISRKLGDARDLDVLIANLRRSQEHQIEHGQHSSRLIEQAQDDRERAYDRLISALNGKRFRPLMFELLAWSEAGSWLRIDDAAAQARRERPVGRFAAKELQRRRRKIRKTGRHLERLDPTDRHRVRIATKKLRYATEFFSSLAATPKRRRRQEAFAKTLADLQDHLGVLNDLTAREKLVSDFARREGKPTKADVRSDHPQPRQLPAHEQALAAATRAYRAFAGTKRFWKTSSPGKTRHHR
jgi:inorganic triphosphatase YgiF